MKENFWIRDIFDVKKPIIGMVHLRPLPGSPFYSQGAMSQIIDIAIKEAEILEKAGVDGLQIENMWDHPYLKDDEIGHETTAALAVCAYAVISSSKLPVGINCHLNGSIQAIAAAVSSGAQWIRIFEFVNTYISNSGIIEASGPRVLRFRHAIGGDHIKILADVLVKHGSHFITSDRDIKEQAHDIESYKGDAVIITGGATGEKPTLSDIQAVKVSVRIPVFVGSGITTENVKDYIDVIDGAIVGSEFKEGGKWQNPVSFERTKGFMDKVKSFR